MATNPEITFQKLVLALGLKSTLYAHTMQGFVNALAQRKGGNNEC
jgi:hypothetical protein